MAKQIILLSGPVASGKSSLAEALRSRHRCLLLKTHELIREHTKADAERRSLQLGGDQLDKKTNGRWVAEAIANQMQQLASDAIVVVDAVRKQNQIDAIRLAFGNRVTHVHLDAPDSTLTERYRTRPGKFAELAAYADVRKNQTEQSVRKLASDADIVIDTDRCSRDDVLVRVASQLGFYGRSPERLVDVLVGGQYGSEGKGHIASYLAPDYDILVRVGGPNAGHKVYEEPEPRTFHHLPSGTQRTESRRSRIVLGPGAVLWIPGLRKEIAECELSAARLAIDPNAMIIEPADQEFEAQSLTGSIGSTGQGVGAATSRKILRTAAAPPVRLAKDAPELKPYLHDTCQLLDDAFAAGKRVLLEGTQGTGLSIHHGHYPHVTSRDSSVGGCLAESGIAPSRVRRVVMVCRTYPIRVESPKGKTSGPMVSELEWSTIASRSGVPVDELNDKERTSTTKKKRRVGEFDWTLLRRASSLNGPTDIALTFADYITVKNRKARRFEQLSTDTIRLIEEIERVASAPVSLVATRFHFRSIIDRRSWS